MNRVVYYISLLILTGLLSFFMFLSSFSFADLDNTTGVTTEEKSWYLVSLGGTTDNSVLHYVPMSEKSRKIQPNNIIFGEIGRLSSIMYLSQS